MSTQPIRDYLTKQLLIDKNIVTYRSLSRVLTLNVNVAKNELADFFASDGQSLAATYLLSGQIQPVHDEDVDMDPYAEDEQESEDGEYVPQTEIVLVGERDLESAQAQFTQLDCMHVYSLSPSVIRDAGLLCTPTEIVRNLDNKKGAELAAVVGKVISSQVNISTKPLGSWGNRKPPAPVAGPSKVTAAAPAVAVKKEEDTKPKEKAKLEKPKATGKLDFSKAKTKPLKKEEEKPAKAEPKRKTAAKPPSAGSTIGEKVQAKMEESKRGVKRKSALVSDSEDEAEAKPAKPVVKPAKAAASAQSSVRLRKGVILSDDEDDEPRAPTRKGKGKVSAPDSDSEARKDLHAMMDIDDEEVTRVSRTKPAPAPTRSPSPAQEPADVDMSDGEAKPAPVKRKAKKVTPVGRNGLKKKRIIKSKTRVDEKGYMVTDDYSEYESVDEEEAPAPKAKAKSKAKEKEKEQEQDAAPAKAAKAALKPKPAPAKSAKSGSKPQGQATMASFFGKSKSK